MNRLLIGALYGVVAQILTFLQLQGGLKYDWNKKYPIKIIGFRHGEKMHETLLNKEDMMNAKETSGYFMVSPDTRDLNYEKFFTIGKSNLSDHKDYTSESSQCLSVEGMKKLLIKSKILKP
jgi:UDP-glucose 4-epimerase